MLLPSNPDCVLVQMRAVTAADDAVYRRMRRASIGSVAVARIESVPQSVSARLDEVPQHARESTQFQFVHAGRLVLEQGGEQTAFGAGELAVYDASAPFVFHYTDAFSTTIAQVPTVLLDPRGVRTGSGHPIDRDSLGHRMLAEKLLQAARLPADHPMQLSAGLIEAMRQVVAEYAPHGHADVKLRRWARDDLVRAVLDHVHQNHMDPSLTVASLAARFHVSLRTLYAAFEDREETIGATIRALRLQTAGRLLLTQHISVAAVANTVGYTDVTAFIRAWRTSTGNTPGEWRRRRGTPDA